MPSGAAWIGKRTGSTHVLAAIRNLHRLECALEAMLVLDWEAQQAHGPQGQISVKWTPGHDVSGDPVIRIRFDRATCRACPTRSACTSAKDAPRQLTVRTQAHHEAIQAARQRQGTPEFKAQYALQAGVESSLSQGIRRFDLRQSRSLGLARTHLQQLRTATAMNVVWAIAWRRDKPWGNGSGSQDTLPDLRPILCHAKRCFVKAT
jgi:hypothetical protein